MGTFGWMIIAVLVVAVLVGLVMLREPSAWDEVGRDLLEREGDAGPDGEAMRRADEAELRALIERKRAARGAGARTPSGPPWDHLDREVVVEARELIERRRARLERQGRPIPDEQSELERLLGPPHA